MDTGNRRPLAEPFEHDSDLPKVVPRSLYRNEQSDASELYRMTFDRVLALALEQMAAGKIYIIGFHRVMLGLETGFISGVAGHPALEIDAIWEPPSGSYHSDSLIKAVLEGVGRVLAKHPSAERIANLIPTFERLGQVTDTAEARIAHLWPPRLGVSVRTAQRLLEGYCQPQARGSQIDGCLTEMTVNLKDEVRHREFMLASIDGVGYEFGRLIRVNREDDLFWKVAAASGVCTRIRAKITPENSVISAEANLDRQIAHKLHAVSAAGNSYCERRYSHSRDQVVDTVALSGEKRREAIAISGDLLTAADREKVIAHDSYESYIGNYGAYLGILEVLEQISRCV
jgi:hypothetical protein